MVNETTGLPGVGFIAAPDVPKALVDVFNFDWLGHGAPKPEEFAAASKARPSNGVASARTTK